MGAGSLSDARAVALLQNWLIPVHVSELCTSDLIAREDLALVRDLDARLEDRGGLFGGTRELILSPEGEILSFGAALYDRSGGRPAQTTRAGREDPDGIVQLVMARMGDAVTEVRGALPPAWSSFVDGSAPQVAAVLATPIPEPVPEPGAAALRVCVRNCGLRYDTLTGCELMPLDSAELAALVPSPDAPSRPRTWPRAILERLARACVPRGLIDSRSRLEARSIQGTVTARITGAAGAGGERWVGELWGELVLAPRTRDETGRRPQATCLYRSELRILGRFELDAESGEVTSLRVCGAPGAMRWRPPFDVGAWPPHDCHHLFGADLVVGTRRAGTPRAAFDSPLRSREEAR